MDDKQIQEQLRLELDKTEQETPRGGVRDGYPDRWLPDRDQGPRELIGRVVRWEQPTKPEYRKTRDGRDVHILVLEDPDGRQWAVWDSRVKLHHELQRTGPREGDVAALRYLGQPGIARGDQGHDYVAAVHRSAPAKAVDDDTPPH